MGTNEGEKELTSYPPAMMYWLSLILIMQWPEDFLGIRMLSSMWYCCVLSVYTNFSVVSSWSLVPRPPN